MGRVLANVRTRGEAFPTSPAGYGAAGRPKLGPKCNKLSNDVRRLMNLMAKLPKPFGKVRRDT